MKKSHSPAISSKPPPDKPLFYVAIGASAGGLEAVSQLLKNLSPDTGMTFVYIQHLDPNHESLLSELLTKTTTMPVMEARHLLHLDPNHVYVIPSNQDMELIDGVMKLVPRKPRPAVHLPIDQFFVSLAERHGETAIGIVLSGNASDGTIGLKAIKHAGGITMAQDESAKFQSMPQSAIAKDVVDLVLSPENIARELERLSQQTALIRHEIVEKEAESADGDEELSSIIQLIKKSNGVDFSHYKVNTIRRRILRRMLLYKLEHLPDYVQYLNQHPEEINILYNDILINVTSFFRDPDAVEFLKLTLLPLILKNKSPNNPLRIWVPACSSGEEAYSLAMIVTEVLGERASSTNVQIFATDLSEKAITKARQGVYSRNELANVSPKRLQRFFTKVEGHYRIIKPIRELCIFAPHNIFKDPPFSRLDLISFCNLLIYLDPVLQKKAIATFHYALNNDGYLMLGKSETIGSSAKMFAQFEKKYKIYSRKNEIAVQPLYETRRRLQDVENTGLVNPPLINTNPAINVLEKTVDHILLHQYVPASVVINQELEILQFRGSTGLFLEPSPGRASLNLLKMARPGLTLDLRNAMHKVIKTGQKIKKSGLQIEHQNSTHQVSFEVVPLLNQSEERLFLIVFTETTPANTGDARSAFSRDTRVKQLEAELEAARDDMRSIVEEQEATNEELQSANEEILSSNEELQSMNEELETSKEEVESTNEELMTINQELHVRNEQLAEAYKYSEAVLTTIREALLILDNDLRIKSANRPFYEMFRLREDEVEGRLIYELDNNLWNYPRLRGLLEEILLRNTQFQGYELMAVFPRVGEKSLMLNARKVIQTVHDQQLILLAIEDLTDQREARRVLAEREIWFESMADSTSVMIWVANADQEITFFNRTWLEYTGRALQQGSNSSWIDDLHPDDRDRFLSVYNDSFKSHEPFQIQYRLRRHDGAFRWILVNGKPMFDLQGDFSGFIGSCTEVHTQKLLNEELENRVQQRTRELLEANTGLTHSNQELEQFAYVASHDLQEPLRKIVTYSDLLQKRHGATLPQDGKDYIQRIVDSTQRMTRLINEVLNYSRTIRTKNAFVPTDLNKIVQDVLADFDLSITQKEASVNMGALPTIEAIPLQMRQLFYNLLSNALKFSTPQRKLVVNITADTLSAEEILKFKAEGKPEEYVEITVQDNGIGFDQGYAEKIFVIFQRLHGRQEYGGTGIGLALCRRVANNHGGEIRAESTEGKGAAFHVLLPLKQPDIH